MLFGWNLIVRAITHVVKAFALLGCEGESYEKTFRLVARDNTGVPKEEKFLTPRAQFTHRVSASTNRDMYFFISIVSTLRISSGACRLLNFRYRAQLSPSKWQSCKTVVLSFFWLSLFLVLLLLV